MGNRLIVSTPIREAKGPSDRTTEFFKGVRVKWLDYFVSELKVRLGKSTSDHLDLNDKTVVLKWKDYFSIFSSIQEQVDIERKTELKSSWHPASLGYVMEKDESYVYTPMLPPPPPSFPEGFTDDETSDISGSDSETDTPGKRKSKSEVGAALSKADERKKHEESANNVGQTVIRDLPDGWDPTLVNPMFYGYKHTRSADIESAKAALDADIAQAEARAIERAMRTRSTAIGDVEKANKGRELARLKKIADVESVYKVRLYYQTSASSFLTDACLRNKENQAKREMELIKNRAALPPDAFQTFKAQWDAEFNASVEAFAVEVEVMKKTNYIKTTNDRNVLLRKLEDLDAFKDAEAQEMPSAERLEQISRVELHYW